MTQSGTWTRTGPRELLVPESSATAIAGLQRSDSFAINEDHSDMVKFSANEMAYRGVLAAISQAMKELLVAAQQEPESNYMTVAAQETLDACSTELLLERKIKSVGFNDFMDFTPAQWLDYYRRVAVELQSGLKFEEIGLREADIADAQDDTFSWIVQDEGLGFKTWLKSTTGLYWIQGKPGSGKSTLMSMFLLIQHFERVINHVDRSPKACFCASGDP